jgi:hypothetical protein
VYPCSENLKGGITSEPFDKDSVLFSAIHFPVPI